MEKDTEKKNLPEENADFEELLAEFDRIEDEFMQKSDNELDDILEFIEEDDDCRADLKKTLIANDIYSSQENKLNKLYRGYDSKAKGCSQANPFVIDTEEEYYCHLEYDILDFIFDSIRLCGHHFDRQSLIIDDDGRKFDCLEVTSENFEYNEDKDLFETVNRTEEYWFDITAGFDAMSRSLK